MKKALIFTALLFCHCMSSFAQQPGLRIPDVSASAGSLVVTPILIAPSARISALEIRVRLPQGLSAIDNPIRAGDTLLDHSFTHNTVGNEITIVVFSTSLSELNPRGGSVVQLLLRVSQQASDGQDLEVEFLNAVASDSRGEVVALDSTDGKVTVSGELSEPVEGQNRLVFPQVANGSFAGGSFGVTLIVVNLTDAEARARVRFTSSDGTPFEIGLVDGGTGSEFPIDLAPRGVAFVESNGLGSLATGFAVVDSSAPVGGTLLFTLRDGAARRLSEAGVGNSPLSQRAAIPVSFEQGAFDTGLAIANPQGADASIDLTLKDCSGNTLATSVLDISGGQHLARFASEFFDLIAQQAEFQGSLEVASDQAVSIIALRQAGGLLTTLPVIPLEPDP